jgi:teichuronic acid biosynthesis glycosyltransferase TuaG
MPPRDLPPRDLISIITPCYNSSEFISFAIESVLAQTYQTWEMIIVDDHSTDNSIQIINNYIQNDGRIKLIELKDRNGPAMARNMAIAAAAGRYIAFLDSDDIWLPEKLEKQESFMRDNDIALCYSSYYTIDQTNNDIGLFITKEIITYNEFLKNHCIGNLTAIYDSSEIGKRYLEKIGHGQEDYVLWLHILKEVGAARGILEPLAKYRLVDNSYSSNKLLAAYWIWHIYREIENLSLIKSIYSFICYAYHGFVKHSFEYRKRKHSLR